MISVIINSVNQLNQSIKEQCEYIIFAPSIYTNRSIERAMNEIGEKFCLFLPIIARTEDVKLLKSIIDECNIPCVMSNNAYGLELGRGLKLLLGYGHNILNTHFNENGLFEFSAFVQSVECFEPINNDAYIYAFGHFPLMSYAHCPYKNVLGLDCGKDCGSELSYRDELSNTFSIKRYKLKNCYFQLLNSLPIYLKQLSPFKNNLLLDFSATSSAVAAQVFEAFMSQKPLEITHTKGLFGKKLK